MPHDIPVIMCAMCGKPVDRIQAGYSIERMATQFVVWCHGAQDKCEVGDEFIVEAGREGVAQMQRGVAFTGQPSIAHQKQIEAHHAA